MISMSPTTTKEHAHLPGFETSTRRAAKMARREKKIARLIGVFEVRLKKAQNTRLGSAVVFFIILVAFATQPKMNIEFPIVLIFALAFSALILRTRRISAFLLKLRRLREFSDRQEKRLKGLPSGRWHEALARRLESSAYARDLGLIGSHSLWSLIDETLTDEGESRLAKWIFEPLQSSDEVKSRQTLIQRLANETWFFTRWGVSAKKSDFQLSSSQVQLFLKKPFSVSWIGSLTLALWIFWAASVILYVTATKDGARWQLAFTTLFPILNFAAHFRAGSPFLKGVGLSHHLAELEPIFLGLEKRTLVSENLRALAPITHASGPSKEARKLGRVLAFLSIQSNPLAHLLVNLLCPWSLTGTYFLERRRRKIAATFPQCLDELAEIEALGSLVIFTHYQTSTFPQVLPPGRTSEFDFEDLYHPLIDRRAVVANSFRFENGKSLGLITGSNMSGKSTFLRTLGLNQILANMGAPVFAKRFVTQVFQVETCIEVSDSLRDGYSYFYAEVRRLKALLDSVRSRTPVLYLIDEIFRGTNNRERQIGSRSIIRALSQTPTAIGFVSTHDLELTSLEGELEGLLNLHFRDEISPDGRMVFSYLLKQGASPTTNALKIMASEGLPIE